MPMIIENGYVLQNSMVEKKNIRIEGNKITEIGSNVKGSDTIDASNHLIMPGLVNTHTHVAMTLLRGYADDIPLSEWLKEYILPKEMKLKPVDCYYGSLLGIIEMIRSGTTCFSDMYFHEDQTVRAVRESGMRAVLSYGIADMGDPRRGAYVVNMALKFAYTVKDERIHVAFGPHSPYMCSSDFLMRIQELAQKMGKIVHIHLHEAEEEIKKYHKKHEKTPIELLETIGFLQKNVCAAHVVHVSDRELDILKKNNVKVLHCPASNLKLGNGISPVAAMVEKGMSVSLGTDGAASNNSLDLFREMRLMVLLQKAHNSQAMKADTAVKIATENGGNALNWKTGKIEEGFLADLIFIDLKKVSIVPRHNLVSNIVYSMNSSAVDTVIIDGKVIMENGTILTVDEEKIMEKAQEKAFDLVNR
jgi:5-methylthioadenosine/S-adenosylhomocysteine deaminase